jgi:hypothetical protein
MTYELEFDPRARMAEAGETVKKQFKKKLAGVGKSRIESASLRFAGLLQNQAQDQVIVWCIRFRTAWWWFCYRHWEKREISRLSRRK